MTFVVVVVMLSAWKRDLSCNDYSFRTGEVRLCLTAD